MQPSGSEARKSYSWKQIEQSAARMDYCVLNGGIIPSTTARNAFFPFLCFYFLTFRRFYVLFSVLYFNVQYSTHKFFFKVTDNANDSSKHCCRPIRLKQRTRRARLFRHLAGKQFAK